MGGSILFACFWVYLICVTKTGAIDADYYYNSLRSSDCYTLEGEKACRAHCGELDMMCHRGRCYCEKKRAAPSKPRLEILILDDHGRLKFDSSKKVKEILILDDPIQVKYDGSKGPKVEVHETENENTFLNELNLRPSLRHHIAHFCPNLDIARQCIRKCMKSGKPAFCGKDHYCYCGHKYTPHDKNSVANADEVYRNFQDLYEKYFGKKPAEEETIVESQN
ncbi:uncharacterized protein isoform X1 [Choristoneura fumiferana]|uniref:uncharacterized protein isoform X1 n=1 Tax=Choristoneura fumiferana TaxID=7141 RepID=UPI003D15B1F4